MASRYDLEQLAAVREHQPVGVLSQEAAQIGLERILQVRREPIMYGKTWTLRLGDDARQLLHPAHDLLDQRGWQAACDADDAAAVDGAQLAAVHARADEHRRLHQRIDLC